MSREVEKGSGRVGKVGGGESWKDGKGGRVVCWKGGKGGMGGRIVGQQSWRGWRAVMWQVGKGGGGNGGSEEVARWERCEGSEVARWERWENGEVARWEVSGFVQEWGKQSES